MPALFIFWVAYFLIYGRGILAFVVRIVPRHTREKTMRVLGVRGSADVPSIEEAIVFRFKAAGFQVQRSLVNRLRCPVRKYAAATDLKDETVLAESVTPLWTAHEIAERNLIAGKIQNLRVAAKELHGVELPAGATFSFWAQVGKPTASKGYVSGRELRQGCVIPSVGGGLCQLSNALYSAALDAGLEIVERHAHTKVIPGSLAEVGRDATVFWNYVDLRFRSTMPIRIEVELSADSLIVRFRGQPAEQTATEATSEVISTEARSQIKHQNSCQTCGVTSCFRSVKRPQSLEIGRVAYLLDEYWSEFDRYLQENSPDAVMIPLDGKRWRKANYAWSVSQVQNVYQAIGVTLLRSLTSRQLATQGKARQEALLKFDQQLAETFAVRLQYDMTHLVVMQNLLPFLWRDGHLGGRTFDVLMTRSPLFILQDRLDQAAAHHPESSTLADFRANAEFVALERHAIAAARHLITPHRDIAALFPEKAILLDWNLPEVQAIKPPTGKRVLFPASTVGRKGAYELRQVARDLGLEIAVLGRELEGENFWEGVTVQEAQGLETIDLVVLPAYVEHRPRVVLSAIAQGIPAIVSEACGLAGVPGVVTVPTGDVEALKRAIAAELTGTKSS